MHPDTLAELGALRRRDLDDEAARRSLAESVLRERADSGFARLIARGSRQTLAVLTAPLRRLPGLRRAARRPRRASCISSTCASYSSSGKWLRATNSTGTPACLRMSSSASTSSSGVPA